MSTLYPDAADRNSQQERDVYKRNSSSKSYKGDAPMKLGDFSQEKGAQIFTKSHNPHLHTYTELFKENTECIDKGTEVFTFLGDREMKNKGKIPYPDDHWEATFVSAGSDPPLLIIEALAFLCCKVSKLRI